MKNEMPKLFTSVYKIYKIPLDVGEHAFWQGRKDLIKVSQFAKKNTSGKWVYAYQLKNLIDSKALESGMDVYIRFFGNYCAMVMISWTPPPFPETLEQGFNLFKQAQKEHKEVKWGESTKIEEKIGGYPAIRIQYTIKENSQVDYFTTYVVLTKKRLYAVTLTCEKTFFDPDNTLKKIKKGIEFIEHE